MGNLAQLNWQQILGIGIYVVFMLFLGFYFARRVKNTDDFWISGRTLGPWVISFSYVSTYYSTVAIIGSPAWMYLYGMGYLSWDMMGSAWLFSLLPFLIFAYPLRRMSGRLGAVTLPEWMAARFQSDAVRVYAALLVFVMSMPYCTAVLMGIAKVLNVLVGMSYATGIIISAIVVLLYVSASGFFGVAWTDFFQMLIMIIGMCIIFPLALFKAGGLTHIVATLKATDPTLLQIPGQFSWGMFFTWTFVWGFICWGQPQLLTRFMAFKDAKDIGRAMIISVVFGVSSYFMMLMCGVTARAMWPTQFLKNPDVIMPTLVQEVAPTFIATIFLCAVLAAAMSTLSSVSLVVSSAITRDIYEKYYLARANKKLNDKIVINISRAAIGLTLVVATIWALNPPNVIQVVSTYGSGTIGAAFGAVMFYGLFWKRANWQGCLAAMIVGTVVTLIWFIWKLPGFYPYFPGIIAAAVVFPIVSLLTPPPSEQLVNLCFGKRKKGKVAESTTVASN